MSFKSDDMEQSIARDESWLREHLPEPTGFDMASLKLRLRVELNQQWLTGELADDESAKLVSKTKQAVRNALNASKTIDVPSRSRLFKFVRWTAGALATAACVLFAVNVFRLSEPKPIPEISYLSAFEQYQEDDYSGPYSSLRSELTSLAVDKANVESEDGFESYDELRDSIDALANPSKLLTDWS